MTTREPNPRQTGTPEDTKSRFHWLWLVMAGTLLVILIGVLLLRPEKERADRSTSTNRPSFGRDTSSRFKSPEPRLRSSRDVAPGSTAEEIVASKLIQFVRNRREVLHNLAKHFKVGVPAEFDAFFDALEAGRWEEAKNLFKSLEKIRNSSARSVGMALLWPVVHETFGVADIAHNWPAQKHLDYGQAVLGSLRPGMVYVGGTDAGRFIPTLLNDTSAGERHVVLTQNWLADPTYLTYVRFLYADRLNTLSPEDTPAGFRDYFADVFAYFADGQNRTQVFAYSSDGQNRTQQVQVTEKQAQASGVLADMATLEKLFQMLMDKNPDVSFAIEQSFPFKSTYSNATPLGPIMELRVQDEQNGLTPERAAQSVAYWNGIAQQLLADPEAANSPDVRRRTPNRDRMVTPPFSGRGTPATRSR